MSITMNIQVQSKGGDSIKLKDKKIGILGKTYTRDKYGNSKVSYAPIAPPLWAYFWQLSMKELYGTVKQVEEEALYHQLQNGYNHKQHSSTQRR